MRVYQYTYMTVILLLLCAVLASEGQAQEAQMEPRGWQTQLTDEQRAAVEQILLEAHPRIEELRQQLHDKVKELKTFAYDQNTDPDVLPRLGRELQALRDALHEEIVAVERRITEATGLTLHERPGRGCAALSGKRY